MTQSNFPTYVLNLDDAATRSNLRNAKRNQEFDVLVRIEGGKLESSIPAKCVLDDRDIFRVTVKAGGGEETHEWAYQILLDAVKANSRGKK